MMRYGWLSDLHLNFVDDETRALFFEDLSAHDVDGWLVSGDLGESLSLVDNLKAFNTELTAPTFFVLGNHDFYHSSLAAVSSTVSSVCSASDRLTWLTESAPIELNSRLMLVGDDCWSDGRLGNAADTPVELNDFSLIEDLSGLTRKDLLLRVNELGSNSGIRLESKLASAADGQSDVLIVTHVPPFAGATWHRGKISSPDFLPWFSCAAAGEAILKVASAHPETTFVVLCGHTHSGGQYSAAANVTVHTARAEYGFPGVHAILEVADDGYMRIVQPPSMG